MPANEVKVPYELFSDVDGDPLESGYIYVGTENADPESSPVTVYWDRALTIPAAQPFRTIGGYVVRAGSPANFYVDADGYSITVRNKNSSLIYTKLSVRQTIPFSAITGPATLTTRVDSVATLIAGTYEDDIVYVASYYAGWEDTAEGPKGGHWAYQTGADNTAPSVGSATTVSSIGTGVQRGLYYDANGVEWSIYRDGSPENFLAYGIRESNTGVQNYDILQDLIRNFGADRRYFRLPRGTYALDVFNPNNCVIFGEEAVFDFTYNAAKSPVMGQLTNCEVHGIQFNSLETNLAQQRCQVNECDLYDCKFTGWRDTSTSNAWGVYFDGAKRTRLVRCGFENNTQSDIAVVDGMENLEIIQCYALDEAGDPLHVNCEPNGSTDNNNVTVSSTNMGVLYLLENGSGGTSNQQIIVDNCRIASLRYDGARAVFRNCQIDDFDVETEIYFGEVDWQNTLAIGPNLILDPYLMNIGANSGAATTDSNTWYLNSSSGVGTDYHERRNENGVRYLRINDTFANGIVNFRPLTPIAATAGEYYLVVITGRRANGSSGQFCQVYNGASDKNCRVFRQSNGGYDYFTTEMGIVPAGATNDFLVKVGLYATSTSSCDIYAVSVHKILGKGSGAMDIIQGIHDVRPGPRLIEASAVPTMSTAALNGFQSGDGVIVDGVEYYWDGNGFSQNSTDVEDTAANIANIGATINTSNKYSGKKCWDTTNNRLMRASGSAAGDAWYVIDGSASVTPS